MPSQLRKSYQGDSNGYQYINSKNQSHNLYHIRLKRHIKTTFIYTIKQLQIIKQMYISRQKNLYNLQKTFLSFKKLIDR